MSKSELAWRSLHDVGLASWFGGSVFGSIALPRDPSQIPPSTRVSKPTSAKAATSRADLLAGVEAAAWQRWTPVLTASMAAHVVGGAGLLTRNWSRIKHQKGVPASTIAKTALTALAVGLTLASVADGVRAENLREQDDDEDRETLERLERRMQVVGPLIPVTTGALLVLGALEGEQQRPGAMAKGLIASARESLANVA